MNKLKRMRWTGYVEIIHAFFAGKLRENRPLKGLGSSSEHNIKADLKEIKYDILD
jgi:hypothetical protein